MTVTFLQNPTKIRVKESNQDINPPLHQGLYVTSEGVFIFILLLIRFIIFIQYFFILMYVIFIIIFMDVIVNNVLIVFIYY